MRAGRAVVVAVVGISGLGCLCIADPLGPFRSCAEDCAREGKCGRRTWAAGDGFYRCFPRDDADCEQSEACREDGRCDYRPERDLEACVAAEPASCLGSAGCTENGRCRPDFTGRCRSTEAGCVATAGCAERDRCDGYDDGCIVPRSDGPLCEDACRTEGACTERDGKCLALSDADCRGSSLCRTAGTCSLGSDAVCVATSDADCAATSMCELNGDCSARDGVCVVGKAVCEDECLQRGWCGVRDAVCVARTAADCEDSLGCLVLGDCGLGGLGSRDVCTPRSQADCAASLEGLAFGRVELRGRSCTGPGDPRYPGAGGYCFSTAACALEGKCLTDSQRVCHAPEEFGLPPIPPERRPKRRGPVDPGEPGYAR